LKTEDLAVMICHRPIQLPVPRIVSDRVGATFQEVVGTFQAKVGIRVFVPNTNGIEWHLACNG
jgi:hypothetical protein